MSFFYHLYILNILFAFYKFEVSNGTQTNGRKFPEGFLFGASTSAYQIEGAWDQDGKSESIWDHLLHTRPDADLQGQNADVAANSYRFYGRDVEIAKELGLDFYRFSLSWPRILPNGFSNQVNKAGIDHYNSAIDEMLKNNVEPMITLYHWDLPQILQDLGGWTNPLIVDWYADYVRIAFEHFGDRVKYWITINEPFQICNFGYGEKKLAPATNIRGIADYMCNKYVLLAHAQAYHIYDKEFRGKQKGSIFITINAEWMEEPPLVQNLQVVEAARQLWWGIYAHPIFSKNGDFPPIVKEIIANKSAEQGFPRSRLIPLTAEEVEFVRGTSDFFGLNHYSTYYVSRNESFEGNHKVIFYIYELDAVLYQDNQWVLGKDDDVKCVPWGFHKLLSKIKEDYNNPPVFVTENGVVTKSGLNDDNRIKYFRLYFDAMLDALDEGSDIRGYAAWSLIDSYEWANGFLDRYGLYEVDYDSPKRTRTPRKSAFVYKEILRTRTLDMEYEPSADSIMTIDGGH